MKNKKYFKTTEDAIKWYHDYVENGYTTLPFMEWLEAEHEPPKVSLLDAAKDMVEYSCSYVAEHVKKEYAQRLADAIRREEAMETRNFNKFRTAREAFDAWQDHCGDGGNRCRKCHIDKMRRLEENADIDCAFLWLYSFSKEEPQG